MRDMPPSGAPLTADANPAVTASDVAGAAVPGSTAEALSSQLDVAAELARVATWRHDLHTDRLAFSPRTATFLGLPPGVLEMPLEDLLSRVHPDDHAALRASALRARAGQAEAADLDLRVNDAATGRWRLLRTRQRLQRGADGQPQALVGASMDISGPYEEARRAAALVDRLERLGEEAGMGYWRVRHGPGDVFWARKLYELHGLDPRLGPPPLRRWLRHHVHPEDRRALWQALRGWLDTRPPLQDFSFRLLRSDGAILDVTAHARFETERGRPQPYGLLVDVTEQRAAQAALRRNAEQAQLIARTLGLGTWEQDLATGEVQWDDQMWRLRGCEPGDHPNTSACRESFVHPEDLPAVQGRRDQGLRETTPLEYEFRVVWPDGSVRWLSSRSITERDAAGRPVRRIGLNWDVTEARTLRQAAEERMAAQRELRAKSQFLSRMSHELRTPLNAVLGFTQLLLGEGSTVDARTQRARLEQIHAAGRHLLALIDDVLDLSRLEGGEMTVDLEPVDLRSAVASALPMVQAMAAERGVSLQLGALDERTMADPTRLRQVLVNLLSNGIKYNRPGGHVRVEASSHDGVTLLRVADTGRGIEPAQLDHLFEPFNRLGAERGTVEGTGIGLAIVKTLVERMDGTVHVHSRPGEGSCFELRLRDGRGMPLPAQQPAQAHMMALAAIAAGRPLSGRILYVEDNPVNAMILQQLVAHRGELSLRTAENGADGLSMARAWRPDLVLLDMQLPDIDGMEIFRRLRADPLCAEIPCIALSANAMPGDIQAALNAGFVDYWTKPLDFALFHAAVDTLFAGRADAAGDPGP